MFPLILDTDVASRIHRGDLRSDASERLSGGAGLLTLVTVAEILRGGLLARWGATRMEGLRRWVGSFKQVDSSPDVARVWAEIVVMRESSGRPISQNDAWVAACCVASGLPLATLNRKDFQGIEGLRLL